MNIFKLKIVKQNFFARDFSNFSNHNFNKELLCKLSDASFNYTINEQCNFFTNTFISILDKYAPPKLIKTMNNRKPWVSSEIRKIIQDRDNMYRRAKAANSVLLFNLYKYLRNKVKNLLDTAKNTYLTKKISDSKNAKELWKTFRSFGIVSSSKLSPLKIFSINQLNDNFSSISSQQSGITSAD